MVLGIILLSNKKYDRIKENINGILFGQLGYVINVSTSRL
jgi:hypothetical protein